MSCAGSWKLTVDTKPNLLMPDELLPSKAYLHSLLEKDSITASHRIVKHIDDGVRINESCFVMDSVLTDQKGCVLKLIS